MEELNVQAIQEEVDRLTIEELKEYAFKALRLKEENKLRVRKHRRLKKEKVAYNG